MNSGLAASYSATGDLRWLSVVTVSSHTDGFFDVVVGPDAVYAVGQASEYAVHPDGFGYGLVSKLDPSTGAVRANLTFGDDHYMSQFNSAVWIAGHLVCGGLTQLESSERHPAAPGIGPGPEQWPASGVARDRERERHGRDREAAHRVTRLPPSRRGGLHSLWRRSSRSALDDPHLLEPRRGE